MEKKYDANKEKLLLKQGITLIEEYNCHFVAYKTRFLGISFNDEYIIHGETTKDSIPLHEFCFGYDDTYQELHLLDVYQTKKGKKYAAIEISMCVYAFWEIIE